MVDPAKTPGERRLAHPPSDRYRAADADAAPEGGPAAPGARGLAFGVVASLTGAAAIVVLGGVVTVTAGLIVAAAGTGWAIGALLRPRAATAIGLAILAVALGQLGLWAYAQSQGGVLGLLDLLWQVYGGLVPLEFAAAGLAAWIAGR